MTDIFFDGGCKPNPGMMEVAVVIPRLGVELHERLGRGTNNEAEWIALLMALEVAKRHDLAEVEIRGDSQLVVNQANGTWKCKKAELHVFLDEFRSLRAGFRRLLVSYVPREKNPAGLYIEQVNGYSHLRL